MEGSSGEPGCAAAGGVEGAVGRGGARGSTRGEQWWLSSGGALGPAAHPQLSVPASISRVAPLLAWMDRPTSPKAAELRPKRG